MVSEKLTPSDIQVLQLAADGESIKSGIDRLSISESALKMRRHKAMLKLGADTIAHAVAQAFRQKLIQ